MDLVGVTGDNPRTLVRGRLGNAQISPGKNLSLSLQKVAQHALWVDGLVVVRYNTSDVFAVTTSPRAASRERSCSVESRRIPAETSVPVCQSPQPRC